MVPTKLCVNRFRKKRLGTEAGRVTLCGVFDRQFSWPMDLTDISMGGLYLYSGLVTFSTALGSILVFQPDLGRHHVAV